MNTLSVIMFSISHAQSSRVNNYLQKPMNISFHRPFTRCFIYSGSQTSQHSDRVEDYLVPSDQVKLFPLSTLAFDHFMACVRKTEGFILAASSKTEAVASCSMLVTTKYTPCMVFALKIVQKWQTD